MVESTLDWKKELLNDNNFEHKTEFSYDLCLQMFEDCGKDLDNINPYLLLRPIWEITKAFKSLSSALSVGFSDITTKVQIWRDNIKKFYPDTTCVQDVIEKELSLKITELNGENSSKFGHKKNTTYYEYTSCTRTLLRLSWFLDFFNTILVNSLTKSEKSFSDCIKDSYEKALAPHHPWLVRKGASVGISFAPSKREKAMKSFFGGEEKWDDSVKEKVQKLASAVEKVWKRIHEIYDSKKLLELP